MSSSRGSRRSGSVSSRRWTCSPPGRCSRRGAWPPGRWGPPAPPDALARPGSRGRVHQRGLADAGAAGDHQHLPRAAPGAAPRAGSRPAPSRSCPRPRVPPSRRRSAARAGAVGEPQQPFGDAALGPVQAGEEHAGRAVDRVGHHVAVRELERERLVDHLGRDLEQLDRERVQLVRGQRAVALVHGLGERIARRRPGRGSSRSSRCRAASRSGRRS